MFKFFGKRVEPLRFGERRHHAHDGAPVHHRQAGAGEAGNAAENDHGEDSGAANQQPDGDGFLVLSSCCYGRFKQTGFL